MIMGLMHMRAIYVEELVVRGHIARSVGIGRATASGSIALLMAITACVAEARTWHVPGDAYSIQGGIDLASSGDDVLVDEGQYFEYDLAVKDGLLVHSVWGAERTVVSARGLGTGFRCNDLSLGSVVEGFTIESGYASGYDDYSNSGGGIRCVRSSLRVTNCVIRDSGAGLVGGGISAWDSEIEISGCVVSGCTAGNGGGIYGVGSVVLIEDSQFVNNDSSIVGGAMLGGPQVTVRRTLIAENASGLGGGVGGLSCESPALEIVDCVIARNGGYYPLATGIAVWQSEGTIAGCTITGNRDWFGGIAPSVFLVDPTEMDVTGVTVAFNEGMALTCLGDGTAMGCCDVFGNTFDDNLCGADSGGNFSLDPLFCDAGGGDYSVDALSPCLPGNHPDSIDCGRIGALGQGCGMVQSGACCLADGSCIVADQQACEEQGGTYQGNGTTCEPSSCEPTAIERTTWGRLRGLFR